MKRSFFTYNNRSGFSGLSVWDICIHENNYDKMRPFYVNSVIHMFLPIYVLHAGPAAALESVLFHPDWKMCALL